MLPDPDGLELQLFQPPAGLVAAAVPLLPVENNGLVKPLGLDHVLLHVSDIEKSLPYYHLMYGAKSRLRGKRIPTGCGCFWKRTRASACRKPGRPEAPHRSFLYQGRAIRSRTWSPQAFGRSD